MGESTFVIRYAQWIIRHPWLVILGTVLLVMAASSGMKHLTIKTDYRIFFSEDNPQLLTFEALGTMYTKNDNVMFILAPKDGNVFSKETLEAVRILTEKAWQTPYSIRVDSLANFQNTKAEGDDLRVRNLIDQEIELTDDNRKK